MTGIRDAVARALWALPNGPSMRMPDCYMCADAALAVARPLIEAEARERAAEKRIRALISQVDKQIAELSQAENFDKDKYYRLVNQAIGMRKCLAIIADAKG